MKVGDAVKVTRDFPRIGIKAGGEALVRSDKGNGNWEVSFAPTAKEQRYLVVISEWIEEIQPPEPPASPSTRSP
jgi:hypothetical protein